MSGEHVGILHVTGRSTLPVLATIVWARGWLARRRGATYSECCTPPGRMAGYGWALGLEAKNGGTMTWSWRWWWWWCTAEMECDWCVMPGSGAGLAVLELRPVLCTTPGILACTWLGLSIGRLLMAGLRTLAMVGLTSIPLSLVDGDCRAMGQTSADVPVCTQKQALSAIHETGEFLKEMFSSKKHDS